MERIVKMSPEELQKRRVEKGGRVIMDEVMCAEARAKAKLPTNYYADELFMILGAGVEVIPLVLMRFILRYSRIPVMSIN